MTTTRRLLALAVTLLFSFVPLKAQLPISAEDAKAFAEADWTVVPLNKDATARSASIQMFNSTQFISVITYNPKRHDTALLQLDNACTATTDKMAEDAGYTMAANGSYFNTKTFYPSTYVRVGKKVYGEAAANQFYRVNGVIAFKDKKGRKPVIEFCDSSSYTSLCKKWYAVLAAGPMLMKDGERIGYDSKKTFYIKRHPRTLIGYDKDKNVTLAVIDGRFPEGIGATIEETAIIAELLGLQDAINLDGGGSSTIWSAETGILNHPYDNKKFDHEGARKVPNCIAVRKR